jgi:phage terminase large subunit-like protein
VGSDGHREEHARHFAGQALRKARRRPSVRHRDDPRRPFGAADREARSTLQFKSYDQGREAFQGTRQHRIHLDEEPKLEIYAECLLRLMSTVPGESNGTLVLTETPMLGVSDLMISFLPDLSPEPDSAPVQSWDAEEEELVIDEIGHVS